MAVEVPKEFVEPNALVADSFRLARHIYDSGYRPDVLVVLWRGGTPIGMIVHEFFLYRGVETYHAVVKAVSYEGLGERTIPRMEHFDSVFESIPVGANVLLVDDIFDSGATLKHATEVISARTDNVRIATLYYKESANTTDIVPDYYLRKTDRWIVFPHELMDLSPTEIQQKGVDVARVVLD